MEIDNTKVVAPPKEEQMFQFKETTNKITLEEGALQVFRQQCIAEHKTADQFIQPKRDKWYKRLKIYNNQKRDEDAVGDTLFYTVFQTVLASLYDDTLSVEFAGVEEGDDEPAENLNSTAEFDHDAMHKEQVDYEWDWDSLFFGRGLLEFAGFDRSTMTPMPRVIDPLIFLRDPEATNEYDLRFYGKEISMTARDMLGNPAYFNVDELQARGGENPGLNKYALQARREAQGLNSTIYNNSLGENKKFDLVEWYTYYNGRKVITTWSFDFKTLHRMSYVEGKYWNLITRPFSPTAHDWDGTNVGDLTEDKQRARATTLNTVIKAGQAQVLPMYLYDKNKIPNPSDLKFGLNKAIGIDGAVSPMIAQPLTKAQMNMQTVDYILNQLQTSAERATATPEIQQGALSGNNKTFGEISLSAQKSDVRYSLTARIFKWSEKAFWQKWYYLYKEHFHNGFDKKVIRIAGTFDKQWRTLTRENLIAEADPDIYVVSRVMMEGQRSKMLEKYSLFFKELANDPTADRRYALKFLGKLIGLKSEEINKHLPKDPEELQAEMENKQINKGELPQIQRDDNHQMHLIIHQKANATKEGVAHMEAHWAAIMLKKEQPQLFPQAQTPGVNPGQVSPGQMGQANPVQMSAPTLNMNTNPQR